MTLETAASWADKTPDQKLEHRLRSWLNPPVSFVSPEAEEAYRSRVTRLADAMLLQKTPDRVPAPLLVAEVYPAVWGGLTPYDAMYDFDRASQAFVDFNLEFQPDAMVPPMIATQPGSVLDLLDYRLFSWPGHGIPREASLQYVEKEWMKAEEYDDFIADPADYLMRRRIPRIFGALQGFSKLGYALDTGYLNFGYFAAWTQPEVLDSLATLMAAGREAAAWLGKVGGVLQQLQSLGFPPYYTLMCQAPFDLLADLLRGTKEMSLDLYRRPEKVLAACERLAPLVVKWVLGNSTIDSPPCVFWPLHKGDDAHMSAEQFKEFYWPTLRKVALSLIDEGFIPVFFGEGKLDTRLEVIAADLPVGRTVWLLDRTDMAHAKATLGKVAAIQGNVPLSLLQTGTPEQVREYCRKLIEVAAPGGGFLLDSGAALHQGNAANLHAMIRAASDFGTY
jgi:hypothetical protein